MTVQFNERTLPLSLNASNTTFSSGINLAWDFTGVGAVAHGTAWKYDGATAPVLVPTTQGAVTYNGEPGRAPTATSSIYDYTNTTDYGWQCGTADFTLAFRINTGATLPAGSAGRELFRLSGSGGTTLSLNLVENPSVGWYITAPTSSTAIPVGTSNSPEWMVANSTYIVWVRKQSGIVQIWTQNVTAQTALATRFNASAAATTPIDATAAARTILNFGGITPTPNLAAVVRWSSALSTTDMLAIGKDFWDTNTNSGAVSTISITSPANGAAITATSVISGTYTGTAPTGVDVQFNGGAWITGTSPTISGGAWSATFILSAGTGSLLARETNATTVISSAVTSVTVSTDTIAFTVPGTPATAAVPFRTFQRDGSNNASVRITGTYTGTPTTIEYSWNGASYATLVASPAGGVFDQTVTLTGPAQGDLTVRFSNNTPVYATLASVGVDDVCFVAGQSNHVGGGNGTYVPATAPVEHTGWKASIYDKTGRWRENVETATDQFSKVTNASIYGSATATYAVQAGSSTAYNSYFGKLSSLMMAAGRPMAFVPSALGSTAISSWAVSTSTSTLYGAMLAVANTIGVHKYVAWWQGEADCSAGTTRSAYESALNAIINDWCARFPGVKWVLMNLNATGNTAGTGGTGASDTGFNAIHAAIAAVGASNVNVMAVADMNGAFSGSIHYATSPEITEVANRAYSAFNYKTASVTLVNASNAAQTSLTGLKWAWFDSVTPDAFGAPADKGTGEITDGSGVLTVSLTGSTKTSGQVGWLVVTDSDGTTAMVHKAFSGPVTVA